MPPGGRRRNEDPADDDTLGGGRGTVTDVNTGADGIRDPNYATRMPDPDDPMTRERLRQRAERSFRTSGRRGTIMTKRLRTRVGE